MSDRANNNQYEGTNLAMLQSDFSLYLKKMKGGITTGGGGPTSLQFLNDNMVEKVRQIDKCLQFTVVKKAKQQNNEKEVDYQKLKEKLDYLMDEQRVLLKEEQSLQDRMKLAQANTQ
mmetsp:Transcript_6853/g.6065  ORF Transcript_6853/g.6065 Transcript_6853/m.6065 type:complete len:117 (-) Transcript_6853:65-415(-)